MAKINVYEKRFIRDLNPNSTITHDGGYETGKIIACVKCNRNLDNFNGRNWDGGEYGQHKGITQLQGGQFVLIHSTDYKSVNDWAEVISRDSAVQEILKCDNSKELLEKYGLKKLADKTLLLEAE